MIWISIFVLAAASPWGQTAGGNAVASASPSFVSADAILPSQIALMSAASADVLSSRGGVEQNPLLGRGSFGAKQSALVLGITAALILAERPLVKRYPAAAKWLKWINFGGAAVHGEAAIKNWRNR